LWKVIVGDGSVAGHSLLTNSAWVQLYMYTAIKRRLLAKVISVAAD